MHTDDPRMSGHTSRDYILNAQTLTYHFHSSAHCRGQKLYVDKQYDVILVNKFDGTHYHALYNILPKSFLYSFTGIVSQCAIFTESLLCALKCGKKMDYDISGDGVFIIGNG